MKILVLGGGGQLAADIERAWKAARVDLLALGHRELDITDRVAVAACFSAVKPDAVVNCAAMTNVARCEDEPALAFGINAIGAWNAARAAAAAGARFIQISTDYVFDGEKRPPLFSGEGWGEGASYVEGDARRALNAYGASKLAGEDLVRSASPQALIVRVSGLFGVAGAAGKGGNFVETMLRLAREGKPIRIVADQVTSPTNTADIADALLAVVCDGMAGELHLAAAGGGCSWHEFATAIFAQCGLTPDLMPVTAAEFGGALKRPSHSVLATRRGVTLPPWPDGLARYLQAKGHARL